MTASTLRIVVDTNILVSGICWPKSELAKAYFKAVTVGELLISNDVRDEQLDVFGREKFDKYASVERRLAFLCAHVDRCDSSVETSAITKYSK